MRTFYLPLILLAAIAGLQSCSGSPSDDEIKTKLAGTYCNGRHKLELHNDGTYMNQRFHKGALSGTPVMERCEGTFKIEWDKKEDGYMLVLEKSTESSSPITHCDGSRQLVWKAGKYTVNETKPMLKEMFDNLEVTKDNCD
jgi:hypothetical protein